MAQYGGEQYKKEEGHHSDEHAAGHNHNQLHSTTTGHEIGGTGTNIHSTTAGHVVGTGGGQGYQEGTLHRSGSGSSSSSESDGEGGRRKKKGVVEKIKEKLPGGTDQCSDGHKTSDTATVVGGGQYGEEGNEKKGLMDKIKEKLPGTH